MAVKFEVRTEATGEFQARRDTLDAASAVARSLNENQGIACSIKKIYVRNARPGKKTLAYLEQVARGNW